MPDFVGSLNWAWEQSGDQSMGASFNFTEWCDQWLKSSGVNVLEPLVEWNEDFSIKSLSLKQKCHIKGKNRLRLQKINVALIHGDNLDVHVIRDIIISDKEELNAIAIDFNQPVKAIIPNWEDHGYTLQEYDTRTLDFIINDLYKLESELDKVVVWTQMWQMTTSCKLSPLKFFNFVVTQYPHVKSQQILSTSLQYLSALMKQYMPTQIVGESSARMFEVLM